MGRIADTLTSYRHGDITLDEASDQLGMIALASRAARPAEEILGGADDPYDDAEDDGHELSSARNMGEITPAEYAKLYAAYSGARRAVR